MHLDGPATRNANQGNLQKKRYFHNVRANRANHLKPGIRNFMCPETRFAQERVVNKEWPRYCRKVYWTKMAQNGQSDRFGQNDLTLSWILAFARPKWTKMVHFDPFWPKEVYFGPFRSANRTLATPELNSGILRRFARTCKSLRAQILKKIKIA